MGPINVTFIIMIIHIGAWPEHDHWLDSIKVTEGRQTSQSKIAEIKGARDGTVSLREQHRRRAVELEKKYKQDTFVWICSFKESRAAFARPQNLLIAADFRRKWDAKRPVTPIYNSELASSPGHWFFTKQRFPSTADELFFYDRPIKAKGRQLVEGKTFQSDN